MKKSDIDKVIKQLAIDEGVTVVEIRREISKAIDERFSNKDPIVQAHWRKAFKDEKKRPLRNLYVILQKR